MIKAHCLSCSNVFSGFSVWDYDDLVCECGSTELEIYSDKKLILSRNSKICERCQIKYLPQNWLDLKKKNLCVDCIELPAIQSIQTSQEKAVEPSIELSPRHPRSALARVCWHGPPQVAAACAQCVRCR